MTVKKMLMAGVVAAMGFAPVLASAATIVDLRFAGGGKNRDLVATGGTFQVEVWATVTGANASSDEGLLYVYGSVQSTQSNGGGLVGGGITSNQGASLFTTAAPNGQPGTAQNLTADGVADWGTTATNNTNTIKFNSSLNNGLDPVFGNSPGVVANLLSNGVEFLVGTFNVSVADLGPAGGVTTLNWVKGTGTIPGPHSSRLDGSATAVTSAATYTASVAGTNGVTLTVIPEPTSFALLGLAAGAVLVRRRRA